LGRKNGGKFNRFFIKRYLATLGLEDLGLRETKEARDKRQDLGLEDFRTLRLKMIEARGKKQDWRLVIWDWRII